VRLSTKSRLGTSGRTQGGSIRKRGSAEKQKGGVSQQRIGGLPARGVERKERQKKEQLIWRSIYRREARQPET